MTESKETNGLKQGTLNILNGIGLGVIAALVPAAILGQLMKALLGVAPAFAQTVINITTFTQSLLAAMAGFCGAGGLGAVAINYGYYRFEDGIMWIAILFLVILVQAIQSLGMTLVKKVDRRAR